MSESAANFIQNEAKNVDIYFDTARLFNEIQDKICRLPPFEAPAEQIYYKSVGMNARLVGLKQIQGCSIIFVNPSIPLNHYVLFGFMNKI